MKGTYKMIEKYQMMNFQGAAKIYRILAVDCGMKLNIIRHFLSQSTVSLELIIVPWDDAFGDRDVESYDGLFLSNGPGNPELCDVIIKNIRYLGHTCIWDTPVFGTTFKRTSSRFQKSHDDWKTDLWNMFGKSADGVGIGS